MTRITSALILVALAACTAPEQARLQGSFTADRADDDIRAFMALAEEHGAAVVLMESYPEQFAATMHADDCQHFAEALLSKANIASATCT